MKVRLIELTDLAQSAPTRTVSTLFCNALIEEVPGATMVPNSLCRFSIRARGSDREESLKIHSRRVETLRTCRVPHLIYVKGYFGVGVRQPAWTEAERLEALLRYGIVGTSPEPAFDDIVRIAAHVC